MSTTITKTVSRSFLTKTTLALVASFGLIALSSATAGQPQPLLLPPGGNHGPIHRELPRFGFSSYNVNGYGEQITGVRWGGIASRMGLEQGDVILSLNGYRLNYHGAWKDALREAMFHGGWVQLKVRDVRSGRIAIRETYVGGNGPNVPHSHVTNYNGPITTKKSMPHYQQQHQQNGVEQIKKIVDLFDNNP
jgi:hypothetical protein